ncbi:MAG: hypothetical protein Faunusvirus43_2 [Faunusvirus sp.]|jgi:hypothetical protein|uniref:Uncharacterized protein n=1 Tax=Faunusvirus sp. TaxID=2487766 RepID=A0A3G4ZXT9_9VIRU|nr:MAG: hypothetical protein Faunusvirus43_2 [Faunusvirus sp.]
MSRIILFCVITITLFLWCNYRGTAEHFNGLTPAATNDYQACCDKYGCESVNCQYAIHNSQSPMVLIGGIYPAIPGSSNANDAQSDRPFSLYRRYNIQAKQYEYFYKTQDLDTPGLIKIPTASELFNNDAVKLKNGVDYKISLFSQDGQKIHNYKYYNNLSTFTQFGIFNPSYSDRLIPEEFTRVGVLTAVDPKSAAEPDKLVLLEQVVAYKRGNYKYYAAYSGVIFELTNTMKVQDGDIINLPNTKTSYRYHEVAL